MDIADVKRIEKISTTEKNMVGIKQANSYKTAILHLLFQSKYEVRENLRLPWQNVSEMTNR